MPIRSSHVSHYPITIFTMVFHCRIQRPNVASAQAEERHRMEGQGAKEVPCPQARSQPSQQEAIRLLQGAQGSTGNGCGRVSQVDQPEQRGSDANRPKRKEEMKEKMKKGRKEKKEEDR